MSEQILIAPEVLVPRLGDQLVSMGLLTQEQLNKALEHQQQQTESGEPALLGQTLVDLGYLDRPTLDRAVTEQIIFLRSALEDANQNLEKRVQMRTAELEEALRRLSELNQMKANFVANISHELRTPLTHIRGYLELLASESLGALNKEQKKSVDVSMRSAGRLQTLIEDLILFSMASHGELSLQLKPISLPKLAANIVQRATHKSTDRNIEIENQIPADLPPIQADEEKLSWVIGQLLDNAIKFTKPGGKVTISVSSNEPMAVFSITDTGIGIPPERLKEIFEPFHQLDNSATRRYGGTGLGLSLVRTIIEAHGSLIEVKSQTNEGTTISFPLVFSHA